MHSCYHTWCLVTVDGIADLLVSGFRSKIYNEAFALMAVLIISNINNNSIVLHSQTINPSITICPSPLPHLQYLNSLEQLTFPYKHSKKP